MSQKRKGTKRFTNPSIEISLYGKAYIPAAKDTWHLLKDRGIDALVNDSLIGTLTIWGSYLNGFICGLFGYLYLRCECGYTG